MADNISDKITDEITIRLILLERLKSSLTKDTMLTLRKLHLSLTNDIVLFDATGVKPPSFRQKRLLRLLKQVQVTIAAAYRGIDEEHTRNLREVAMMEGKATLSVLNGAVGIDIATVGLSKEQIQSLSSEGLTFGAKSSTWWSRQQEGVRRKFEDAMRMGVLRGEGIDELVKRVKGTRAANFTDGILTPNRVEAKQADALVRTSVQNAANGARIQIFKNNSDIVKGLEWVSTLDTRTSKICIALDGKLWNIKTMAPIGHSKVFPGPTAHWNCRSTQISVLKSWKDLNKGKQAPGGKNFERFFREELSKQGIARDKIGGIVASTRASMDGQVAATTDFSSWLSKQSKARRVKILGKGRMDLFDSGQISVDDLTDQNSRPLTLEQLKAL